MKVVIAMDSFKGSMRSMEAGRAAREGILRVCSADVVVKPLADGGEGTTQALVEGLGGRYVHVAVTGPQGRPVTARYGILADGKTAVLEMAEAAGLMLVREGERDAGRATTRGVGEMILDAIGRGCRDFIVGIGGSATSDGGVGMLQALGYEFLDAQGKEVGPGILGLGDIETICVEQAARQLKECRFRVACDVGNPLYGESGAVFVYGPQKGIREAERAAFDEKMRHYAERTGRFLGRRLDWEPGAGAAGGLGFAFLSYFPEARLETGAALVLEAVGLKQELADADVVLTGEGRLDRQTAMGKAPIGVARLAKCYGARVIAFAGGVAEGAEACHEQGIDAYFPIVRGAVSLAEAMEPERAKRNMAAAVEEVFRVMAGGGR